MIIRQPNAPPPQSTESISAKLQRLRASQRPRPLINVRAPPERLRLPLDLVLTESDAYQRRGVGRDLMGLGEESTASRRRGTAGPPAPPSWSTQTARSNSGLTRRQKGKERSVKDGQSVEDRYMDHAERALRLYRLQGMSAATLFNPTEFESIPTLVEIAGRVIVRDLGRTRSVRGSKVLLDDAVWGEEVGWLPLGMRLELMDVATREKGLTEFGVERLLNGEADQGEEEWQEQEVVDVLESTGCVESIVDAPSNDVPLSWEDQLELTPSISSHPLSSILTTLNLAYSSISTLYLSNLLLSSSTSSTSSLVKIPVFPHLNSLNLSYTHNIPFNSKFFEMLKALTTIQSLSLIGKTIPQPQHGKISLMHVTWVADLAAATRHVVILDLSFDLNYLEIRGQVDAQMRNPLYGLYSIDWKTVWPDLKTFGFKGRTWMSSEMSSRGLGHQLLVERIENQMKVDGRWIEVIS